MTKVTFSGIQDKRVSTESHVLCFFVVMTILTGPNRFYLILILLVGAFYTGRYFYFKPSVNKGEKAPVFEANLPGGQPFSLDHLEGSFVLLDFWGSWCGPCIAEVPELKALHRDFGSVDGNAEFYIVSIGIERSDQHWRGAIRSLQLDWPYHVGGSGMFDSPLAELYGVKEVPTKIFIDKEGRVIGVNPSFHKIREVLESDKL